MKIGSLKKNRAECELFTSNFLDTLYAFGVGTVLFKPTKCAIQQFRATKAEATSYFIAGKHRACAEDSGFALNPWINVRFENSNMILEERGSLCFYTWYHPPSRIYFLEQRLQRKRLACV